MLPTAAIENEGPVALEVSAIDTKAVTPCKVTVSVSVPSVTPSATKSTAIVAWPFDPTEIVPTIEPPATSPPLTPERV